MEINEEIDLILEDTKERMDKSCSDLSDAYLQIRSGRATPGLVEDIRVEAYGDILPLNQLANINIPEARLITVDVWDKSVMQDVEKAIQKSGRNLNPQNDGSLIRIALPELNEERRHEFVKIAKQKAEDYKIAIRNIRRDANDSIKKLKDSGMSEDQMHDVQADVQKITDTHIAAIDSMLDKKEKEIMTV